MKNVFLLLYNFLEDFFHLIRIKKFLKTKVFFKRPTIFDVGSHKGKITRLFYELYRDAKIYSFEPNKLLHNKIKQKNFKKSIKLYDYALGEKKKRKNNKYRRFRFNKLTV